MSISRLLDWVREREAVRQLKEEGLPFPWTNDPIIGKYRFCNVRREDDRVTIWIRHNIRERFAGHPWLWFMLCIARYINWPQTLEELMLSEQTWPYDDRFSPQAMGRAMESRAQRGDKVWTGAYMITAPATKGAKKTTFVAEQTLGQLWDVRGTSIQAVIANKIQSLKTVHRYLSAYNGWGQFMAYQAVVDMRFTNILNKASDIDIWAAAGPGTLRGLNRIHGRALDFKITQERALDEMRWLWPIIKEETNVACDFSDVPNILCETDKYMRVLNNEGAPRALYVPGRGS